MSKNTAIVFLMFTVAMSFSLFAGDDGDNQRNGCRQFNGSSTYSTRLISARNIRVTLTYASATVEVQRNNAPDRTIPAGDTSTIGGVSGDQFNFNAISDEGIVGEICIF